MRVTDEMRADFDRHVEAVMAEMPDRVHRLMEEITMYIEDHPSRAVLRQMGLRHRSQLCGLYTGVPLPQRHVELSGVLSDAITLFREGILAQAAPPHGRPDAAEIRRQIRLTVLHELGHHHGLDERELEARGY